MSSLLPKLAELLASRRLGLLLVVLPPLCLVPMVALWGVDLPYFDQWELIPRFAKWQGGEFPWWEIWNFHNEHRLFVPELIMLGLGRLTDWDIRWELALNLVLAALTFALLHGAFRRRLGIGIGGPDLLILPLVSLLIFSPSQWGNWSWGWQIQIFLCILLVVASTLALTSSRPAGEAGKAPSPGLFLLALAGATVAPFCFANGLLFLPLGLLLTWRHPGRAYWRPLAWVSASAIVIWLYQIQLLRPRLVDPNLPGFLERTGIQVDYLLHYLAGPIFTADPLGTRLVAYLLVPMSLGLAVFWIYRLRGRPDALLPWATFWAFGLASAAMTAYGRYTFGIAQATSSRYFTIANLYWLGFLGLAILVLRRGEGQAGEAPRFPRWWPALVVAMAALIFVQGLRGAYQFRRDSATRVWLRASLRGEIAPTQDPMPLVPYPDKEAVRQRLETMKRLEISLFRRD